MSFGNTLRVKPLLEAEQIRRFYESWKEEPVHREWPHIWRKDIRLESPDGVFISLNRLKNRLNFKVIKRLCIQLLPVHIYQSALNFTFPERVSSKKKSLKAYPLLSSEYIVDIDAYLGHKPHSHRTRNDERARAFKIELCALYCSFRLV